MLSEFTQVPSADPKSIRMAAASEEVNVTQGRKATFTSSKVSLVFQTVPRYLCSRYWSARIRAGKIGYGTYTKTLKARIMSLTMGIRAYAKMLSD